MEFAILVIVLGIIAAFLKKKQDNLKTILGNS